MSIADNLAHLHDQITEACRRANRPTSEVALMAVSKVHPVEAIVEAFSSMQDDLDKERKVIMKQWAKRAEQIERVMGGTIGMYGDLQGIAGKSLQEIEGLELRVLTLDPDAN